MDVFKLFGTIALKGADAAEKAIDGMTAKGGTLGKVFSNLGNFAVKGMKVAGVAIAGAGTAVGGLVAKSVSAYSEFEQLVGGVETLFKDSAELVQTYADNAYKTAGLSASEYMETVTSFSASLLQSLDGDTEKAAKAADMAVTDMADNMNKMGSSMESIQNAYQGFAKQNYTMLDNLKLGYGGTKEEMERLLEDAEKLSGVKYDIKNLNDVYSAIHVVQTELGITGTTAKEANETISGSFASMKAALDNLITGFGDKNADIDKLFENLLDSADTFLNDNLIPTVERILGTVIKKIPDFLPRILSALGGLAETIGYELPSLLSDLWELFDEYVLQNVPELLSAVSGLITGFIDSLPEVLNEVLPKISQLFDDIISNLPHMLEKTGNAIANNLPFIMKQVIDAAVRLVKSFAENSGEIAQTVNSLIHKISVAVTDALPGLISDIIAALPNLLMGLIAMIVEYFADLPNKIWDAIKRLLSIFEGLWDGIKRVFDPVIQWFKSIFGKAVDGIKSVWNGITSFFGGIWNGITSVFSGVASFFGNVFEGAVSGVKSVFDALFGWIRSAADGVRSLLEQVGLLSSTISGAVGQASNAAVLEASGLTSKITKTYTGKINSWSDAKMAGHAKGGIVTREHIARVGEDGAEAIIPLEHNTEWIDRVAERLNGSGSGDVIAKLDELNTSIKSLKIYLDGDTLVGGIAPAMDKKLGSIARIKRRGAV